MTDYKSMYLRLFNRITDAIQLLQQAQQEGEADFIQGENEEEDC
jgi:hypothetical protein